MMNVSIPLSFVVMEFFTNILYKEFVVLLVIWLVVLVMSFSDDVHVFIVKKHNDLSSPK